MTSPLPAWPYSPYIAHRGGGHLAPENTLAAMHVGAAQGFTMFEFDVKLSRDNVAILMHDDNVDRTTNGRGPARDMSYTELSLLDAGSWHSPAYAGEPVPSFVSVARYTRANGIACNVEIKPCPGREAETGAEVARLCAEYWQAPPSCPCFLPSRSPRWPKPSASPRSCPAPCWSRKCPPTGANAWRITLHRPEHQPEGRHARAHRRRACRRLPDRRLDGQ